MKVFISADHNGFDLKNNLVVYLKNKNIDVIDKGPYELDMEDHYPVFAKKVAEEVQKNPDKDFGIVICGSGIGVCMAANRFKKIRCALGFNNEQVQHGRENDHINMLSLPSTYVDETTAQQFIDTFLTTPPLMKDKYILRGKMLDE